MTGKHSRSDMQSSRRAFTLVELMIALGLLSVIVLLLFSILSRFRNLEEKGQDQTARVRVLRALRESIEKDVDARVRLTIPTNQDASQSNASAMNNLLDRGGVGGLSSTIVDEPLGGLAFGANGDLSTSPFGAMPETQTLGRFTGDELGFDLDVVATANLFEIVSGVQSRRDGQSERIRLSSNGFDAAPIDADDRTSSNSSRISKVTVQTVSYRFEPVGQNQESSMLVRRLGQHTTSSDRFAETDSNGALLTSQGDNASARFDESFEPDMEWLDGSDLYRTDDAPTTLSTRESAPADGTQFPEISEAKFRYFDGHQWVRSWDSARRLSYPVAIEIQFELYSPRELREQRLQAELNAAEDEDRLFGTDESLESINEPFYEEEQVELDLASESSSNTFGVESFDLPYRVIIPVEPSAAGADSMLQANSDRQATGSSNPFTSSRGGVR